MENIKLPDTWQQEAERSSELQEGTYTPQHKITYKHGFIDGSQKVLTSVEKMIQDKISSTEAFIETLTDSMPTTKVTSRDMLSAYKIALEELQNIKPL